jgi:hypothetical protein
MLKFQPNSRFLTNSVTVAIFMKFESELEFTNIQNTDSATAYREKFMIREATHYHLGFLKH